MEAPAGGDASHAGCGGAVRWAGSSTVRPAGGGPPPRGRRRACRGGRRWAACPGGCRAAGRVPPGGRRRPPGPRGGARRATPAPRRGASGRPPRPRPGRVVGAHQGQPPVAAADGNGGGVRCPGRLHEAACRSVARPPRPPVRRPGRGRARRCATRRRHGGRGRRRRRGRPAAAARRATPRAARARHPGCGDHRHEVVVGEAPASWSLQIRATLISPSRFFVPDGPQSVPRVPPSRAAERVGHRGSSFRRARGSRTATTRRCRRSAALGLGLVRQCSKWVPSRALAWMATKDGCEAAFARARSELLGTRSCRDALRRSDR